MFLFVVENTYEMIQTMQMNVQGLNVVYIPVTKKNKLSGTEYFYIVVFDHLSFG